MDTLGHINHTIYLSLLETKHKDFLEYIYGKSIEKLGADNSSRGLLASINSRYIKQVRHPVNLDIGYRVTRVGKKSYDVHQGIFVEGENDPSFQTIHTFVMFNFIDQKSIHVSEEIKNKLREL